MDLSNDLSAYLKDHKSKCRLCVCDSEGIYPRYEINDDIREMIYQLHIEIDFSEGYSHFICSNCIRNLQYFAAFRKEISQKQQQLSMFLNQIESVNSEFSEYRHAMTPAIKIEEPDSDPISFDSVTVKTEVYEDQQPETSRRRNASQCAHCYQGFDSPASLQIHMTFAHQGRGNSDKDFANLMEFSYDNLKTRFDERAQEATTSEVFTAPETYIKPVKTKQQCDRVRVPCTFCGKSLLPDSLPKHIREVHEKVKNFFCDFCGKGFYSRNYIIQHIFKHIPKVFRERRHKCKICGKLLMTPEAVKHHIRYSHSEGSGPVTCFCGKTMKNETLLYFHKRNVHNKDKFAKSCDQCGKILSNGWELKRHIKIFHTEGGRGNFICTYCGKQYDTKTLLNRHLLSHMEKTLCCDEPGCDKRFVKDHELNRHKKIVHLQEGNFVCIYQTCGKAFARNQELQRHVKITHENHKIKCPVDGCTFMAGRRDYMRNHLKKHTELDPEVQQHLVDAVKLMDLVY